MRNAVALAIIIINANMSATAEKKSLIVISFRDE